MIINVHACRHPVGDMRTYAKGPKGTLLANRSVGACSWSLSNRLTLITTLGYLINNELPPHTHLVSSEQKQDVFGKLYKTNC